MGRQESLWSALSHREQVWPLLRPSEFLLLVKAGPMYGNGRAPKVSKTWSVQLGESNVIFSLPGTMHAEM